MKLISLTIKNFLSYGDREQTIIFDQFGIIAFTGNNGHGKSAILEAITWACWGQARKGQGVSKSDDMIMRLGSSDMLVSLIIKAKNNIYKIHRTCEKKHNRMYSQLELYSIIEGTEKNLSSSHQKDTQALIDSILGIDYDMFINTVYVKQAASDEFSRKTPKERKDLLCNILKINVIENTRQKILDDVKKIIDKRELLTQLENKLLSNKHAAELAEIIILKNNSQQKIIALKETEHNVNNEIVSLNHEKLAYESHIKELNEKISSENIIIASLYNKYIEKKILYEHYKKNIHDLKLLQNNSQFSKKTINDLYKEKQTLQNDFDQKIAEYNRIILEKQDKHQQKIQSINKLIEHFLQESEHSDIVCLQKKIIQIDNCILQYQEIITTGICPVCTQHIIDVNRIATKHNEAADEKKKLTQNIESYTTEKNKIIALHRAQKQNEEKTYTIACNAIKNNRDEFTSIHSNAITNLENEINQSSQLHTIQAKKNIIEKSITDFLQAGHLAICKNIIQTIYKHKNNIKDYQKNIHNKEKEYSRIHQAIQLKTSFLLAHQNEINKEDREYQKLDSWTIILEKQLVAEKKDLEQIQEDITRHEKELKIKSNLAHILSKNNLQAAIIEESIPIIEKEANNILSKLTHGNSKIYIESMRDLKSGNMKETLDIKIADHIGLRYYEFFSGGEAFRIDLAIRIALIKLLTQKSGSMIKTFIIDEGFGSQDSHNLDLIIDMLHTLQNEFDLIIIISHLQEMKEQFTTQFFIEKTISGSRVNKLQ